jgi:hypothetical protein
MLGHTVAPCFETYALCCPRQTWVRRPVGETGRMSSSDIELVVSVAFVLSIFVALVVLRNR